MQLLDSLELAILTRLVNVGRYQQVYVKAMEFGVTDKEFSGAVRYLSKRGLIEASWKVQGSHGLFRRSYFCECFGRITEHGLRVVIAG